MEKLKTTKITNKLEMGSKIEIIIALKKKKFSSYIIIINIKVMDRMS